MKNWNRVFIATLITVVIGLAIYVWLKPRPSPSTSTAATTQSASTPQPSPTPTATPIPSIGRPAPVHPELAQPGVREKNEPDTAKIAEYLSMFTTPISFYGRAVDEKGNPVSGAQITYQAANQPDPNASNPKYPGGVSDKDGNFSITGLHGASLYVDVAKEGYYRTPPFEGHRGSYDGFAYAGVRSKDDVPPPTSDNPAIFVLRKKGEGVALAHWGRSINIGRNGEAQVLSLQTGRSTPQGELEVQCWAEDQKKDAHGHYPWQCQVSVIGGGLLKRQGEFDFEAPAEGYQATDEIAPPADRWSPQGKRQYFVKTADGHYARITVNMIAGGDHFMTIESYYNPTPGDRNLEYSPNQQTASQ
jgi:hypothetical protein